MPWQTHFFVWAKGVYTLISCIFVGGVAGSVILPFTLIMLFDGFAGRSTGFAIGAIFGAMCWAIVLIRNRQRKETQLTLADAEQANHQSSTSI